MSSSRTQPHRTPFLLIGAMLLVLALSLTACGSGTSNSGNQNGTGSTTATQQSSAGGQSSAIQQLQSADQGIQNIIQTMNTAGVDAQSVDSNSSADSGPLP